MLFFSFHHLPLLVCRFSKFRMSKQIKESQYKLQLEFRVLQSIIKDITNKTYKMRFSLFFIKGVELSK